MHKILLLLICIFWIISCNSQPVVQNNNSQEEQTNTIINDWNDFIDNLNDEEFILPVKEYQISSLFGPRLKASEDLRYDFHRWIDFHHEDNVDIFSIQKGKIFRIYEESNPNNPYKNSGNTVIIQHDLNKKYTFHGVQVDTIYSLYTHLDQIEPTLVIWNTIKKWVKVGTMWTSWTTVYNHLHFEIRAWTTCSREYQLRNPQSSCSKKIPNNWDPHINPYAFLPNDTQADIQLETSMNNNALYIEISTNRDYTWFNKIVVTEGGVSKTVDFNLRKNIDPNNIDINTFNDVTILPKRFSTRSEKYEIWFEFKWFSQSADIQLYDINDNIIYTH